MPKKTKTGGKKKKAANKEQPGLRSLVQQRILNDVFQYASGECDDRVSCCR